MPASRKPSGESERFKFRFRDDTRWLQPIDAFLTAKLASRLPGSQNKRFLEIGVYKGGWIRTFLENCPEWSGIGLDPYPNILNIKDEFFEMVSSSGLGEKIVWIPSTEYLKGSKESFDLIHIDGEHSEQAVLKDLRFGLAHIRRTGLIICDDIYHREFPGIASAIFKVIHAGKLAPFMLTANKVFLCLPRFYKFYHSLSLQILNEAALDYSIGYGVERTNLRVNSFYPQANSINGYPQIIVFRPNTNWTRIINGKKPLGEYRMKLLSKLRHYLPPVIWEMAHRLRTKRTFR